MRRIKAKQDKEAGIAAQLNEKDKKSKKKKWVFLAVAPNMLSC